MEVIGHVVHEVANGVGGAARSDRGAGAEVEPLEAILDSPHDGGRNKTPSERYAVAVDRG